MHSEDQKHERSERKQHCAHRQSKQQQPKKGNRAVLAPCLSVDLFCPCLKHLLQMCLRGVIPDKTGKHLALFNNIKPETQNP